MAENTPRPARRSGLDILRLLCAFCVVTIHAPFPDAFGEAVRQLVNLAVPCFFMFSGFFYRSSVERKRVLPQLVHIAQLLVMSTALYLLWGLRDLGTETVGQHFSRLLSLQNLRWLLLWGQNPGWFHLWYLHAILVVLLVMLPLYRFRLFQRLEPLLIPLLLGGAFLLGSYSLPLLGTDPARMYSRCWLFTGIPFFLLGDMLKKGENMLKKVPATVYFLLTVLFSYLTLLELGWVKEMEWLSKGDLYLTTPFLAVSIFCWFQFSAIWNHDNGFLRGLAWLGKSCSTDVYILHCIVIGELAKLVEARQMTEAYLPVRPVAVFFVTLTVSALYHLICQAISKHFSLNR